MKRRVMYAKGERGGAAKNAKTCVPSSWDVVCVIVNLKNKKKRK